METYSSLGGKLKLATAGAITATLLLSGAGCAKDENPPVIQQYEMPEWVVDGENIDLNIRTTDDRGVKEVYVQFDSGEKIPLTKVDSKKNGEEVANYEASFKLSPKDYQYSVVARDTANEAKKEGKITVYPNDADNDGIGYRDELKYGLDPNKPNPVAKYVLDTNLGIYLSQLLSLENDGVMDKNEQVFIDFVAKYPKAGELVPGIYAELLLLPDFSMEKFSKIDKNDLVATEKILELASDPKNNGEFNSILNEGIKDKRKYCSPLEGLVWIAYDSDFDQYNPLENGLMIQWKKKSLEKLIKDAWTNTSTSRNYKSDRWKNFDEVVARLNSPYLAYWYLKDNIKYQFDTGPGSWATAKELFDGNIVGDCEDAATFITYCLLHNGYDYDEFDNHQTNAACSLFLSSPSDPNESCASGCNAPLEIKPQLTE